LPENVDTLQIIDKYANFFTDGMQGLKLESIFLALQYENKMYLLDKVKIYMLAAVIERSKKTEPVKSIKNPRSKGRGKR